MRPWTLALGVVALLFALSMARPARAADPLRVRIVVIEGKKKGAKIDPRLKKLKLEKRLTEMGWPSARVLDELTTDVELKERVTLETKVGKVRRIQVQLLGVDDDGKISEMQISAPELGFNTKTKHVDGGTLMLAHRLKGDTALFFAVTPLPKK